MTITLEEYMIIYHIFNRVNGKSYVGQTSLLLENRVRRHFRNHTYLGNTLRKYGLDNFTFSVLEVCTSKDQMDEREQFWIKEINCRHPLGYNFAAGGGGSLGYVFTEKQRERLSLSHIGIPQSKESIKKRILANTGKKRSEDFRERMRLLHIGRRPSEETRKKMSLAKLGKPRVVSENTRRELSLRMCGNKYSLGYRHTEEEKRKISEAGVGRIVSEETRRKISLANKGHVLSEEHKHKLSLAHIGVPLSEETKKNMSLSRMGKPRSEETRRKISLTRKRLFEARRSLSVPNGTN
jgi:group I intron endonuclease